MRGGEVTEHAELPYGPVGASPGTATTETTRHRVLGRHLCTPAAPLFCPQGDLTAACPCVTCVRTARAAGRGSWGPVPRARQQQGGSGCVGCTNATWQEGRVSRGRGAAWTPPQGRRCACAARSVGTQLGTGMGAVWGLGVTGTGGEEDLGDHTHVLWCELHGRAHSVKIHGVALLGTESCPPVPTSVGRSPDFPAT